MALNLWQRATRACENARVYLSRRAVRGRTGLVACVIALAPACGTLKNFNVFSVDNDKELGEEAYGQILQGEQLVKGGSAYEMVNRLKNKLVAAAHADDPSLVELFNWEVQLIDNDGTVNAFALPGGKMAVYTGILPVAQTEAGLAVVMGHEIAHVIERHGTEAMTRAYTAEVIIEIFAGSNKDLSGLTANLLQLKFGRNAELEADRKGLRYMAMAGYDPRVAVDFWTRMSQLGGDAPPEWMSTHPAHDTRIQQIESLLPEVIPIYEANKAKP